MKHGIEQVKLNSIFQSQSYKLTNLSQSTQTINSTSYPKPDDSSKADEIESEPIFSNLLNKRFIREIEN